MQEVNRKRSIVRNMDKCTIKSKDGFENSWIWPLSRDELLETWMNAPWWQRTKGLEIHDSWLHQEISCKKLGWMHYEDKGWIWKFMTANFNMRWTVRNLDEWTMMTKGLEIRDSRLQQEMNCKKLEWMHHNDKGQRVWKFMTGTFSVEIALDGVTLLWSWVVDCCLLCLPHLQYLHLMSTASSSSYVYQTSMWRQHLMVLHSYDPGLWTGHQVFSSSSYLFPQS